MNMHLSEIISDILEPIVETLTDGDEVISTEDLVANIENTNEENEGWHRNRWWGNITEDMYEVCTDCEGSEDYVYDKDNPELCKCFRFKKPSSTPPQDVPLKAQLEQEEVPLSVEEEFSKFNLSEESEKPPLPQDVPLKAQLELEGVSLAVQNTPPPQDVSLKAQLEQEGVPLALRTPNPPQDVPLKAQLELEEVPLTDQNESMKLEETTRTTIRFMKLHRRAKWEARMGWDPNDKSRIISSKDVNPEDLQDFMTPMILVGTDVESLYPNLKVAEVSKRMKEAILESEMKWEDIDYMEAARYVALNWDEVKCRKSKLRKILPRRRGKTGTRPGIKGAGPRGRLRGDQEQWIFDPKAKLTDDIKKELLATVVEIVTEQLFKHHYYTFGGQIYHQQDGGPIGLRGTCAVARVCMQIFDSKWKRKLDEWRISRKMNKRYMDDTRTLLHAIKHGWRGDKNGLWFSLAWQEEDQKLSSTEITKRVLLKSMDGVENYLKFTGETGEDFEGGWLPTLDTNLKVTKENKVLFKMYEKETCSKQTIHKKSAMGENIKSQILSQDLIRILLNTSEDLSKEYREHVVDEYGKKILNSGYTREQAIRILVNGIKGYENKRRRRIKEGRRLRTTAKESRSGRYRKKLLAKSTWFKGKKDNADSNTISSGEQSRNKKKNKDEKEQVREQIKYKSVLFIENTEGGEFLTRMKELTRGLSSSLGFGIKIVERCGSSLRSRFPLSTLWEGNQCGRKDCTTCTQGAEKIPQCTKTSVVYENICQKCNKEAGGKKELESVVEDSIYIGESSRSIYERSKEHWEDWRSRSSKSHILKHQELAHEGAEDPLFIMRTVRFFRTALSRQVGEAVRIMRRGGACSILNSKSEYDRCKIPRLVLEEEDEVEQKRQGERELQEDLDSIEEHAEAWGRIKFSEKQKEDKQRWSDQEKTTGTGKRRKNPDVPEIQQKRSKRLKYDLLGESWGEEEQITSLEENKGDPYPSSVICLNIPQPSPNTMRMIRRSKQTQITDFIPGEPPERDTIQSVEHFSVPKSKEKESASHNIIVCDLFQKKDEVFEQITSEDNIIVCDLFQKNDQVFEQITPEDEKENEEQQGRKEETDRTGPAIGELGVHNKVESGGNGTMAQARTHPSLNIGSSELPKILSRPPKGGEPLEGSKHEIVRRDKTPLALRNDPSLIEETNPGYPYVGPENEEDGIPILGSVADLGTTTINTSDNKKTKKTPEISVSVPAAPPIDRDRKLPLCIATKKGHCSQHGTKMTKNVITSKKWCDRGNGRGFGYKTMKTTKYICKSRLSSPMNTPDVKPDEEGSVSIDHQHVDKERGADKGEVVYGKIEVLEHSICSSDLENIRKPT